MRQLIKDPVMMGEDCFSLEQKLRRRKGEKNQVNRIENNTSSRINRFENLLFYFTSLVCFLLLLITKLSSCQLSLHHHHHQRPIFLPPHPHTMNQHQFIRQHQQLYLNSRHQIPAAMNHFNQLHHHQQQRLSINPPTNQQRQLFARNLNLANSEQHPNHYQAQNNNHFNTKQQQQFLAERRNSFVGVNSQQGHIVQPPPIAQQQQQQSSRSDEKNTQQQQQQQQPDPSSGRMLICYYTTKQAAAPYWPPKDGRESFIVPEQQILGKNGAQIFMPSMQARFVATTATIDNNSTATASASKDNQADRAQQKQSSSPSPFSPIISYEPFVSFEHQNDLMNHKAAANKQPQVELEFSSSAPFSSSNHQLPTPSQFNPPVHNKLPYTKTAAAANDHQAIHSKQKASFISSSYPKHNLINNPSSSTTTTRKLSSVDSANQFDAINSDNNENTNLVATNLVVDNPQQSVGFVPTVLVQTRQFQPQLASPTPTQDSADDEADHQQQQQQRPAKLQMVAIALPVANPNSKVSHSFQQHLKLLKNNGDKNHYNNNDHIFANKNNRADQQDNKQLIFSSPSMSRAFMANNAATTTTTMMNNELHRNHHQAETNSRSLVDLSTSTTMTNNATAANAGGPTHHHHHPYSTATTPVMVPSTTSFLNQRAKSLQMAASELAPSIPQSGSSTNPSTLTPPPPPPTTTTTGGSVRIVTPVMVAKTAPPQLPSSTAYAYRNLNQQQHQQIGVDELSGGGQSGSSSPQPAESVVLVADSSSNNSQQQQRNSVRFATSATTNNLVRFPSSASTTTGDFNDKMDHPVVVSSSSSATALPPPSTALTNNNYPNNRQHNQPIQSSSSSSSSSSTSSTTGGQQSLVSASALVSSPLSTMFDVFGAASHYLMRFKPSSLISPSFATSLNTINANHGQHSIGENMHKASNNSSNSLISLNPFSSSLLSGGGGGVKSIVAHQMQQQQQQSPSNDRMSSGGGNSIASSSTNNFMSRLTLQTGSQRREEICGRTIQTPERRIIGGEGARYGEFPYQVHIKIAKHQCGGALVDKQSIVTAAHCVYHFITRAPVSKLQIVIGAYDIEDEQYQELPPQYFKVNKVKLHPNFRFSASHPDRYDIAILKLDKPVKYTDNVLPVCLPSTKDLKFESMIGTVTGFGKTDPSLSNRYGTRLLQKVDVPIIENNECERWHRTRGIDLKIFPEMMCAGYEDGLKDACVGDSGGPLVVKTAISNSNGSSSFRWTLAGITSAGFGCAQSRQPGIYHRVSHTVDWILENLD